MADLDTSELDAQIAKLEALKQARIEKAEAEAREREEEAAKILVDGTPTKPKPQASTFDLSAPPSRPNFGVASSNPAGPSRSRHSPSELPVRPSRSNFASALAVHRSEVEEREARRTGSYRDAEIAPPSGLKLGPGVFGTDPEGEHTWQSVEPNSGIRLAERVMSHADVQDHLDGRYYIRPSQVYSVARLTRDGATYDMPVGHDWVTIAVVAERSEIGTSGTKSTFRGDNEHDEDEEDDYGGEDLGVGQASRPQDKGRHQAKGKDNGKSKPAKRRIPRKYVDLKLVSLPPRSKSGNRTAPDAHLQLLLFEADDVIRKAGKEPTYIGGSGGAFEKWSTLPVGSVIAVVNPRVLRPLKSGVTPHPLELPLGLNPTSADTITVIGRSMDLVRCDALLSNSKRCRGWVDGRQDQVCEYHATLGLKRGRAGRGELASATTSLQHVSRGTGPPTSGSTSKDRGGGASYVMGAGKVLRTTRSAAPHSRPDKSQGELSRKRLKLDQPSNDALMKLLDKRKDHSLGAQYLRAAKAERENPTEGGKPLDKSTVRSKPPQLLMASAAPSFDSKVREDPAKRAASIAAIKSASGNRTLRLGRTGAPKRSNVAIPDYARPKPSINIGGSISRAAKVSTMPAEEGDELMIDLD